MGVDRAGARRSRTRTDNHYARAHEANCKLDCPGVRLSGKLEMQKILILAMEGVIPWRTKSMLNAIMSADDGLAPEFVL